MFGKLPSRIYYLTLAAAIAGCTSGTTQSNNGCNTDYWVSTTGSDASESGSYAAPFQTVEKARLAVENSSAKGQCTINVNIKSGTYNLQQPLVFTGVDSGSSQHRIVYRAAPENTLPVIISGGVPVSGFTCSGSQCTATVTGLPAGIMPRQFYVDESRAIRSRSNPGMSVNLDYTRESDGYRQDIPQSFAHPELLEAVTTTQWKMMRCPIASLTGNTLIMQNPCWNNANTYPVPWNFQLLSWLENAPEFLSYPGSENMWFLDPTSRVITYNSSATPANAVLPVLENLVILRGTSGSPVSNITFQGLVFSYATWLEPNSNNGYVSDQSANILLGSNYESNTIGHQQNVYNTLANISLTYANNISFTGNTFSHLGGIALGLGTGSQSNSVLNNTFTDISSSAIEVGGVSSIDMRPDSLQKTSNNLIKNNTISYTGQDYYDSAGIYVGFTTGTTITHNTISYTPWSSIAIGWGWGLDDPGGFPGLPTATPNMWGVNTTATVASNNIISSNLLTNFLLQLWDGGAIYTNGAQGPNFSNGLLIELNVAQNKRESAGSNIYYTDGGSKYITLNQNVSLNDPVGTYDFGPCLTGSSISPECLASGIVPYGADMGGCLPVGYLTYTNNYLADTLTFFGPELCKNESYIPAYPVNMTFINNVPTTSSSQVPSWIIEQAGVQ